MAKTTRRVKVDGVKERLVLHVEPQVLLQFRIACAAERMRPAAMMKKMVREQIAHYVLDELIDTSAA